MAESKIDFSFDNLHFSCEGDKDWVEAQLNRILNRISALKSPSSFAESGKNENDSGKEIAKDVIPKQIPDTEKTEKKVRVRRESKSVPTAAPVADEFSGDPLYLFLKEKNADKNQVRKFLATAVYLHLQGIEKFSTPMISKSLKAAHIEKLINASDCLNKNEKKEFCIKDDKEFILTDAGIRSIIGVAEE